LPIKLGWHTFNIPPPISPPKIVLRYKQGRKEACAAVDRHEDKQKPELRTLTKIFPAEFNGTLALSKTREET